MKNWLRIVAQFYVTVMQSVGFRYIFKPIGPRKVEVEPLLQHNRTFLSLNPTYGNHIIGVKKVGVPNRSYKRYSINTRNA